LNLTFGEEMMAAVTSLLMEKIIQKNLEAQTQTPALEMFAHQTFDLPDQPHMGQIQMTRTLHTAAALSCCFAHGQKQSFLDHLSQFQCLKLRIALGAPACSAALALQKYLQH
jgi:hypothetical protein